MADVKCHLPTMIFSYHEGYIMHRHRQRLWVKTEYIADHGKEVIELTVSILVNCRVHAPALDGGVFLIAYSAHDIPMTSGRDSSTTLKDSSPAKFTIHAHGTLKFKLRDVEFQI